MANWRKIIPWIRAKEGGLSRAKTDSASKDPVPDGSGYHTNKGVTWGTFKAMAKRVGYFPTAVLFYQMPSQVWEAIWKRGYWDAVGGDALPQPVADVLADFAWGAGPGTAVRHLQLVLLALGRTVRADGVMGPRTLQAALRVPVATLHGQLAAAKRTYYLTRPHQEANYAGWAARLDELEELTKKDLVPVVG